MAQPEHTDAIVEREQDARDAAEIEQRVAAQELAQLRMFARVVRRIASKMEHTEARDALDEALKELG